ncbi:P-type conjugative transfer protein TrbJ [Caulobacter radicis]|uniref:P-type conjugative transfer protein TrbJ n=1 Tax=Caulobacter radicis TaxID=2172650 RepID=UPI000D57B8B2|nr:P-type conjugative transfer protein TrbJ [Caulobacter radicis]PVM84442.1 P-type conjugative transfer protein TrbJ [Caulobacter radicis]
MNPRLKFSRSPASRSVRLAIIGLAAASLALAPLPGLVTPAAAQFTVFDPTNYAQNLLTAARSLQQVNNQISSLQNELTMLQNMARNLKSLDYTALAPIKDALQQVDALMAQAKGMAFTLASTEAVLADAYPASLDPNATTSQLLDRARTQARAAMDGYRQTLKVQAKVVENVRADAGLIDQLVQRSQGAAGGLEAQQAANQLQALAIKQDQQIQTLMAAQYRAQALEAARQAQVLEAAKLAGRRFIGSASAYTPRP